jgi:hypothetical protein
VKYSLDVGNDGIPLLTLFLSRSVFLFIAEGRANGGTAGAVRLLFSGVEPRVAWIGIGGFVFFGAYEQSKRWFVPLF